VLSLGTMSRFKGDAKQKKASPEGDIELPLKYLCSSSDASVESFQLSRLNAIANLRKEMCEIFDELLEAEVQARMAQWLLARENREHAAGVISATRPTAVDSATRRAIARPAAIGSATLRFDRPTVVRPAVIAPTTCVAAPCSIHRPTTAGPVPRFPTLNRPDTARKSPKLSKLFKKLRRSQGSAA
jgi:hypothetical protein